MTHRDAIATKGHTACTNVLRECGSYTLPGMYTVGVYFCDLCSVAIHRDRDGRVLDLYRFSPYSQPGAASHAHA